MSNDYYGSHESRLDTIIGGDASHYIRLRRCKEEWDRLADAVPIGQGFLTFPDFVREWYGIRLEWGNDNGIGLDYEVVDEKKYMMFVLKFSS
jgi:hypothetical protein